MMYQSKMALAVKANSRVLREFEDAVYIPFGSEYSLLLKNLNSVKALVRVWIDGTDVTDGTSLVVYPNSSIDLERFIKDGNMDAGNRFKFIERTEAISDHRGNKVDDGLIRVEFEFEKPRAQPAWMAQAGWPRRDSYSDLIARGGFGDQTTYGDSLASAPAFSDSNAPANLTKGGHRGLPKAGGRHGALRSASASVAPQSEVGITVEGAVSDQKFSQAAWFPTDGVQHVMVMRVLGEVEGKQVTAPVTVKTKSTCPSCGKANKAAAKFCDACGTGLQIV